MTKQLGLSYQSSYGVIGTFVRPPCILRNGLFHRKGPEREYDDDDDDPKNHHSNYHWKYPSSNVPSKVTGELNGTSYGMARMKRSMTQCITSDGVEGGFRRRVANRGIFEVVTTMYQYTE